MMTTVGAAAFAILMVGACNRKPQAPEAQTTTGEQPRAQAVTAVGCLRGAPVAENTFVLHAGKAEGALETSTYQLLDTAGLNLRQHLNQEVEVTGTVRSEQQIASSGTVEERPAKGTSGKPTVETTTQLDVKKLEVTSVKPTGVKCSE